MKKFHGYNLPDNATHAALGSNDGCYYKIGGGRWRFTCWRGGKEVIPHHTTISVKSVEVAGRINRSVGIQEL